jgi:hypothetical protein
MVLVLGIYLVCTGCGIADDNGEFKDGNLEVRINPSTGVSMYYKGLKIIRDMGTFSIFKDTISGRQNIVTGPRSTTVTKKQVSKNSYTVTLEDDTNGLVYDYKLREIRDGEIRIDFKMETTSPEINGIEFGICKLDPDLFKGGTVVSGSAKQTLLPLSPLPLNDRIILTGESSLRVASSFADVTVTAIKGSKISISDFRMVGWDRNKSFYIYETTRMIDLGKQTTFSYIVTVSPPTLGYNNQYKDLDLKSFGYEVSNGDDFLDIEPKILKIDNSRYLKGENIILSGSFSDLAKEIMTRELSYKGIYGVVYKKSQIEKRNSINLQLIQIQTELPREGFRITVSEDGITVQFADIRGCINSLQVLAHKIYLSEGMLTTPILFIDDYPDISFRGIITELSTPGKKDTELFKRYIDTLSRLRANTLILYHAPEHVRDLLQNNGDGSHWTVTELKEIAGYARSLGIEIIPGMKSKFYSSLVKTKTADTGNRFYDPFDNQSYDVLFRLYGTLLDIYKPRYFFIGHDEISDIGQYNPKGWTDAQIFAYDVTKIHDWLQARNITTLMFGDMLLDSRKWIGIDATNSNDPQYGADTHKALSRLPNDIVILDWHYSVVDSYPTIGYFKENGFRVWGVSYNNPHNAVGIAQSVSRFKAEGIMASDWGFWPTLSPGATSLYALKAGWNSKQLVSSEGEDAITFLSDMLKNGQKVFQRRDFLPVSIEPFFNESTIDEILGDWTGFFDLGGGFDLRFLPSGVVRFAEVSFRISSPESGVKKNCIVVGSRGVTEHESIKISFEGLKTGAIAFLHTMFTSDPQQNPRRIGSYRLIYEDGSEEIIELIENYNITDFRSSPGLRQNLWPFYSSCDLLTGSYLGWRGMSLSGTPLNVQVFIWENPSPGKRIKDINLVAKEGYKISLLGLSIEQTN